MKTSKAELLKELLRRYTSVCHIKGRGLHFYRYTEGFIYTEKTRKEIERVVNRAGAGTANL